MALHLITGGGGYLGSHLCQKLLEEGHHVRVLDLAISRALPEGAGFIEGDILDREKVAKASQGAEVVHHIAFVQSMSKKPADFQRRVAMEGTENVFSGAAKAGAKRVVFTSTIEIYGTHPPYRCPEDAPKDPVGLYGHLKWESEQLAFQLGKELALEVTALRMPTICGRGFFNHRPLLSLLERARSGKALALIGKGDTMGDFVHIDDVIQGYVLAAQEDGAVGEAFNISAREPSSHRQIIEGIVQKTGKNSRILRVPPWLVRRGLPLGRFLGLHELPPEQDGYLFYHNSYAVEKAIKLLGFEPKYTSLQAAMALMEGYLAERETVLQRSVNY